MKNKSNVSFILGFLLAALLFAAYYFGSISNPQKEAPIDSNNTSYLVSNTSSLQEINESSLISLNNMEEIDGKINNPPKTQKDYQALLGTLDSDFTYLKFNETSYNYSGSPQNAISYYLYREIFFSEDKERYNKTDYWASPNETLLKHRGDCEDWAILYLAVEKNLPYRLTESNISSDGECYIIGNEEFTGVFCYTKVYEKQYNKEVAHQIILRAYYFDNWWGNQGQVWATEKMIDFDLNDQEKKSEIRVFVRDFMENQVGYCCTTSYKTKVTSTTKDSIRFLYNYNTFYNLSSKEDFADFIYTNVLNP